MRQAARRTVRESTQLFQCSKSGRGCIAVTACPNQKVQMHDCGNCLHHCLSLFASCRGVVVNLQLGPGWLQAVTGVTACPKQKVQVRDCGICLQQCLSFFACCLQRYCCETAGKTSLACGCITLAFEAQGQSLKLCPYLLQPSDVTSLTCCRCCLILQAVQHCSCASLAISTA